MAVNYGILQQPSTPGISTQIVQTPNYAGQEEAGLLSGLQAMQEAKRTNLANRVAEQNMANTKQQMDFRAQMQPGELAQQQADLARTNAATGLLGTQAKSAKLDFLTAQEKQKFYHQDLDAYQQGVKQGGVQGGLDAMGQSLASHDPKGYVEFMDAQAKAQKSISDGNAAGLLRGAGALHGIMSLSAQLSNQTDPKTGQKMNVTPLDLYTQQFDTYKQVVPNAPKPSTFKSNDQFINSYVFPTMQIAYPEQEKAAAEAKAAQQDNFRSAEKLISEKKTMVDAAIQTYGPDSKEAHEAAEELEDAQAYKQSVIHGKSGEGIFSSIGSAIKDVGKAAANKIAGKASALTSKVPSEAKAPVSALPPGVTPEMIQQELDRRAQQGN